MGNEVWGNRNSILSPLPTPYSPLPARCPLLIHLFREKTESKFPDRAPESWQKAFIERSRLFDAARLMPTKNLIRKMRCVRNGVNTNEQI